MRNENKHVVAHNFRVARVGAIIVGYVVVVFAVVVSVIVIIIIRMRVLLLLRFRNKTLRTFSFITDCK